MKDRKSTHIHVVSFVDISYSWGPAIHFIELWNEYSMLTRYRIIGYAVLEKNNKPYNRLNFELKSLKFKRTDRPLKRRLFKYFFDLYLFLVFLVYRQSIVYIRQSKFGILMLIALLLRKHKVFVEMNGLAKEDQKNSLEKNGKLKVAWFQFMEWLYLKFCGVTVISVAGKITETIKERYGIENAYTVLNGCNPKLIQEFKLKKLGNNERINIGFLGTFTPWDGHEKTGELYEVIKKSGRKVTFYIAGPNVRNTVVYKKYSDNDDFIFYDVVSYNELNFFYDKLDAAFAFDRIDRSETVEQSTLKLLEYWAMKIPILATNARGNEFIGKYHIGYLISEDEYCDKEKFAEAVNTFLALINNYAWNYKFAPKPRTWRNVAIDTMKIIESKSDRK